MIECNSRATSCITTCFYFRILSFSVWSFWISICLIAASVNFPALVVARVFCLIFYRFAIFPLVALRTPGFPNWFFSISSSNWRGINRLWLPTSCSCPSMVAAVASVASDASYATSALLPTSSYSSIVQLLSGCNLLETTSRLSEKDIEHNFSVRYSIKNGFWLLVLIRVRSVTYTFFAPGVVVTSTGGLRFFTVLFLRACISAFCLDGHRAELAWWLPWQFAHRATTWTHSFPFPFLHPLTPHWCSLAGCALAHIIHFSGLSSQLPWRSWPIPQHFMQTDPGPASQYVTLTCWQLMSPTIATFVAGE